MSYSMVREKTFRDVLDPSWRIERKRLYVSFILRSVGILSAVAVGTLLGTRNALPALKKFKRACGIEHKQLIRAVRRLEQRGLLRRKQRDDGNEYLLLTEAGERAFLLEKSRALTITKPKRWDGCWRVLIFDITENKKNMRDAIRKHLRRLGFYQIQKSVFVIPFSCTEEIGFLKRFYEANNELCLIQASSLGEKELVARKYFSLA